MKTPGEPLLEGGRLLLFLQLRPHPFPQEVTPSATQWPPPEPAGHTKGPPESPWRRMKGGVKHCKPVPSYSVMSWKQPTQSQILVKLLSVAQVELGSSHKWSADWWKGRADVSDASFFYLAGVSSSSLWPGTQDCHGWLRPRRSLVKKWAFDGLKDVLTFGRVHQV